MIVAKWGSFFAQADQSVALQAMTLESLFPTANKNVPKSLLLQ
jgi:hypothetical protein